MFNQAMIKETLKKNLLLIGLIFLLLPYCTSCGSADIGPPDSSAVDLNNENAARDESALENGAKIQADDTTVITDLDTVYYIDYTGGTIPIGDLPVGARVIDPSWEWEFRSGSHYTMSGDFRPITWIIVAKDHYNGLGPHVTLLSEELIGYFAFDDSTDRGHKDEEHGHNHWGESGTTNASHGLRPWLNSSGIHSGKGFYQAFSENFNSNILTTTVPNKDWQNGSAYDTNDKVFIPSTTELGDTEHKLTYQIGLPYPYFDRAGEATRIVKLNEYDGWYWTRTPASESGHQVIVVIDNGELGWRYYATFGKPTGVRPALNLKSEVLVNEARY